METQQQDGNTATSTTQRDCAIQHSTETSLMADFELAADFFLQRPAFAAPEEEVYYDGVENPESQVNWDFVVPEDILV
jgi:hypothetical protein